MRAQEVAACPWELRPPGRAGPILQKGSSGPRGRYPLHLPNYMNWPFPSPRCIVGAREHRIPAPQKQPRPGRPDGQTAHRGHGGSGSSLSADLTGTSVVQTQAPVAPPCSSELWLHSRAYKATAGARGPLALLAAWTCRLPASKVRLAHNLNSRLISRQEYRLQFARPRCWALRLV